MTRRLALLFNLDAERAHRATIGGAMIAPTADPPFIEREDAARIDELVTDRHFLTGRVSVSAAHMMGGCSMGRDRSDSVTDSRGRVHGLPWLRIADSALFPDSVEVNPYLTVMALADRVAEGILGDIGALRETPGAPKRVDG